MNVWQRISTALFALVLVPPAAVAEQNLTAYPLTPELKPAIRDYAGFKDIAFGILPGMSIKQVEVILAKHNIAKKSQKTKTISVLYRNISARSEPFVSELDYNGGMTFYFTNPAAGSALYGITRSKDFSYAKPPTFLDPYVSQVIHAFGPYSFKTQNGSLWNYTWLYGAAEPVKCPFGRWGWGCNFHPGMDALLNGADVKMVFSPAGYDTVSPSPGKPGMTTLGRTAIKVIDLQLQGYAQTAGTSELRKAITKSIETADRAEAAMQNGATNILNISGTVNAHALVTGCEYKILSASTYEKSDQSVINQYRISKKRFVGLIQRYDLGPITYRGHKYDVKVSTNSAKLKDVMVDLVSASGGNGGSILFRSTGKGGSIRYVKAGYDSSMTFDHVRLKLQPGYGASNVPSGATMTMTGKTYCRQQTAPLPLEPESEW